MPVIAISSDTPEKDREIAESVAERLGYRLVGREILPKIAEAKGVAEEKLVRALDERPGFFSLNNRIRREYLTYIQSEVLSRLVEDKAVCCGLAAHLYLTGISHALLVRILAGPKARRAAMSPAKGADNEKARDKYLKKMDQGRRQWSTDVFGVDETDPSQYDIVLNLENLDPDRAVGMICDAAGDRKYQPMTYSRKRFQDKVLANRVRELLFPQFPDAIVSAQDGTVVVRIQSLKWDQRKKQEAVRALVGDLEGVRYLEVHVIKDFFGAAAISER